MSTLYNKSLCTVDKTENLDDSEYLLSVPTSLFKGMFLQIAKSNDVDIDHTNALVQKIKKNGQIEMGAEKVALTKKDFFYRLLLHISWNGIALESMPEQYPVVLKWGRV